MKNGSIQNKHNITAILDLNSNAPNLDKPEPRNICHQGTKTRRILFCYSFLVSWCLGGKKKKDLSQKAPL